MNTDLIIGALSVVTLLFTGLFIFCARLLREDQQNLKKQDILAYSVTMPRYRKTMVQCFFIVIVLTFFLGMYVAEIAS